MVLSIVVPTYNVEPYLSNCLDSLVNQGLEPEEYEILVINDGSTDNSLSIARSYSKRYKQIKVYDQENSGLGATRNKGIKNAKGEYIHFLDSDDYLAYNTLPYVISLLEKYKLDILGLTIFETPSLDLIESSNYKAIFPEQLKVRDGISFIANNKYRNEATWYIIKRKYLLETKLLFPVGRFVEDANFTAQLIANCPRIAVSSLDFYRYVMRPNSIMKKKSKEHTLKLISDYEKNVYDFEKQIKKLKKHQHPELDKCIERLEARQQSFVFFLLIKCIKNGLSKKDISPILERLSSSGFYPMNKFISQDYNNSIFRTLNFAINRRKLLFVATKLFPIFDKIYTGFIIFSIKS